MQNEGNRKLEKLEKSCFYYFYKIRKSSQVQARRVNQDSFPFPQERPNSSNGFLCLLNCRDAVIRSCRKIDDRFFSRSCYF